MQIPPLFAPPGAGIESAADASRKTMADDFDRFLTLLTTQLQHQDPLSPLDTTEFTHQLVAFSQVEQSIKQNRNLENLLEIQEIGRAQSAIGMVGRTVDALGDAIPPTTGETDLFYVLESPASSIRATIVDESGLPVRTLGTSGEVGVNRLTWDGQDHSGNAVSGSRWHRLAIEATGADGTRLPVKIGYSAEVQSVRNDPDGLMLEVPGRTVPLDQILAVNTAGG